ncbi:MAG: radical SAM protein [Thermoleophilia bacterium]
MKIKVNVQNYPLWVFWRLRKTIIRTLLHPGRIINYILSRTSQLLRLKKVWGYPPTLVIEPSSYCNLACPMCARQYRAAEMQNGNMSLDAYARLLDDVKDHILFLLFFGYGEPLMNRELPRMIALAKQSDIFVVLSTNGLLLKQEQADRLLDSPPDILIVSLDAVDKETYAQYRVGGDFDQVLANIRYLSDQRKARRLSTPLIDVQFIVMKGNETRLDEAKQMVELMGADKFSFKKVASYYTDTSGEHVSQFLPDQQSDLAFSIYTDPAASSSRFCSYPWRQIAVNWDGSVVPCCKDIDSLHIFGNLAAGDTLKGIINNDGYVAFRGQVKKDIDRIEICARCNRRIEKEEFLQ